MNKQWVGALSPLALATLMAMGGAQAQSTQLEKVEVTGSAIKRLENEGALPVQVIHRADIAKAGVTSAAEIVALLTTGAKSLTDGASISIGGYKDQTGLNAANLRGIGASSTLVLLNGRRLANFASPGDDAGVDLNNIPAAAIQRVEVLLDGASALYGADAIGGVVNFITRKDFEGLALDLYGGGTQEGGAGKRAASLAWGGGKLSTQGFNAFAVLDLQQSDALSTSQRQFIDELKIPERLPHLLSSYPMPANIVISSGQRTRLQNAGFQINGQPITARTINLSRPSCNPPHSLNLPDGIGGVDGCTYDFMRDLELAPAGDKLSLMGRAVLDLGGRHQAFAEVSLARAQTDYVGTSSRIRLRRSEALPTALIPALASLLPGETVEVRARLLEAGKRKTELSSTGQRMVLGLSGKLGDWDYDTALNHSINRVADRDAQGYLLRDELVAGIHAGKLNLFGPSGAAGQAFLSSIQVNDEVRSARGQMTSLDFKASRSLGAGELALGAELRREQARSWASALLLSGNINEDTVADDAQSTDHSRKVWALWGEWLLPITKSLELQAAVRHDHYQRSGGSTNPKLSLRWQPSREWLLRASAGTGFRAPSLNDLYRPTKAGSTSILADPVYCAEVDGDLGTCADFWGTQVYSNAQLKPERSRQASLGLLFEPSKQLAIGLDYWRIHKRDLISTIGDDVILANLAKYEPLVHRYNEDEGFAGCDYDPDDVTICFIELRKENRGGQRASGLDLTLALRDLQSGIGQFGLEFKGSLTLKSERQSGPGDPYLSNLGRFLTDGVVQRWRHRLSLDWRQGPWGLSLSNQYSSGYTDQNLAPDPNTGSYTAPNKVKAYSLWDLSGRWDMNSNLTLRAGVKNLADTPPPFSNQSYFFISGYDPSYTDPRGRFGWLSLSFKL